MVRQNITVAVGGPGKTALWLWGSESSRAGSSAGNVKPACMQQKICAVLCNTAGTNVQFFTSDRLSCVDRLLCAQLAIVSYKEPHSVHIQIHKACHVTVFQNTATTLITKQGCPQPPRAVRLYSCMARDATHCHLRRMVSHASSQHNSTPSAHYRPQTYASQVGTVAEAATPASHTICLRLLKAAV